LYKQKRNTGVYNEVAEVSSNNYQLAEAKLTNDFASISPRIFYAVIAKHGCSIVACNAEASWAIIHGLALSVGLAS
jgi:hypothetical protein